MKANLKAFRSNDPSQVGRQNAFDIAHLSVEESSQHRHIEQKIVSNQLKKQNTKAYLHNAAQFELNSLGRGMDIDISQGGSERANSAGEPPDKPEEPNSQVEEADIEDSGLEVDIQTEEEDADDQEFKRGKNRALQMQSLILSNQYHRQRKLSQALGYAPIKKQHTVFAPKVEYGTAQEPEEEESSVFVEPESINISYQGCSSESHSFSNSQPGADLGDHSKRNLI